jgi:hypothetical protein
MRDYFWKVFHMHSKFICHLYALLCWQKIYSCKKWVLQMARSHDGSQATANAEAALRNSHHNQEAEALLIGAHSLGRV